MIATERLSTACPISEKVLSDKVKLCRMAVDNPVLQETDGVKIFFIVDIIKAIPKCGDNPMDARVDENFMRSSSIFQMFSNT